jgi:hypothetical protein
MFPRLLPLLLALCTLVPGDVLARWVDACHEPDRCGCREDDDRARQGPVVERVDCCAAPCDANVALATPALVPTSSRLAMEPATAVDLVGTVVIRADDARPPPPARTRGPPSRVHAFVGHWLI